LFFQADCDEIELQKISYDIILVTSWPLCHRKTKSKNVTKCFHFSPSNQNFWRRQCWKLWSWSLLHCRIFP